MRDETKRARKTEKGFNLNGRFAFFAAAVVVLFGILIYGIFNLQVINGEEYAEITGSQSVKNIPVRGNRGMITDVNSLVLAKSEKIYNITFYRENNDWDYPTRMLLDTIDILEQYDCPLSVTCPLQRNKDTGVWEFNFGSGVSEATTLTRKGYFYSNNYLTETRYPTASACFDRLRIRFGLTDLENGQYLLQLDKYGNSVVPDADTPNTNPVAETIRVSEERVLQIMAVNLTMQDNAFNSVPISIAQDVPYEVVSEIEGRSMNMNWMGVSVGEKRVYPNGSLASNIIGYIGKIQNADYFYSDLKPAGYQMSDYIGQTGIEYTMETWLTANLTERQGRRVVETDPNGRITRELDYHEPSDGATIKLTIDADYQKMAEQYCANNVRTTRTEQEKKVQDSAWLETNKDKIARRDWDEYPLQLADTGVLIVLDVNNGNVLAMAQYPTYDLNAMIAGGAAATEIIADERGITMNYAVQTRAEPGSIFKMCTGLAALTNGAITPTTLISDGGKFMEYTSNRDEAPTCWTNPPSDHADQTIVEGLTNSCNFFFYTLAHRLYQGGGERLYKYAAQMGLTSKTGIDLPGELRSIVGNQTNLYDVDLPLSEQVTDTPIIVANAIKKHLINFGKSYGIEYDTARLDKCITLLMNMAINTPQGEWVAYARPIFMSELNMTREMVNKSALMNDLWTYLNTIKWGGSQEIQMGIGQSITLLTPIAVARYVGALSYKATVWNPQIVSYVVSPEGEILSQRSATVFNTLESAKPYMSYILKGMEGVVDEGGTAKSYFSSWKYKSVLTQVMCGKTGTSQVTIGGIKLDLENNAWFVALCPSENPEIAIVSFIQNGYAGARATIAARDFIGYYLDQKAKAKETVDMPGGNSLSP